MAEGIRDQIAAVLKDDNMTGNRMMGILYPDLVARSTEWECAKRLLVKNLRWMKKWQLIEVKGVIFETASNGEFVYGLVRDGHD